MKTKVFLCLFATMLMACVEPPPMEQSLQQNMCMRDPVTGQCPRLPEDAAAIAMTDYVWGTYNPDSVDNASCTANFGNALCQVSAYLGGHGVMFSCSGHYVRRADGTYAVSGISCSISAS